VSDDRHIGQARLFVGSLLLTAAIITWMIPLAMSPHGEQSAAGWQQVRTTVAVFIRNSAIGTLVLSALAGWLLFPRRRPRKPVREWLIAGILAVLAVTSIYQLIWLDRSVLQ